MQTPIGTEPPKTPLIQTDIYNNIFNSYDFSYSIDSDSKVAESQYHKNGYGFGLYKFDLVYTYLLDDQSVNVSTGSVGGIYVAVIPDDVTTINDKDTKILYSISSSNKLMNVFNLYLSNDVYKYVNPAYLEWNVVGQNKEKINLTKG